MNEQNDFLGNFFFLLTASILMMMMMIWRLTVIQKFGWFLIASFIDADDGEREKKNIRFVLIIIIINIIFDEL